MGYPRIVFHHIPKCGGTSVARGLALTYYPWRLLLKGRAGFLGGYDVDAAYCASKILGDNGSTVSRTLLAYQLAKDNNPFVFGHYPFRKTVYQHFRGKWAFITILRDPISRWYSEYLYNRYKKSGVARTELDIEEYLDNERGRSSARSFVNFLTEPEDLTAMATHADVLKALNVLSCFDVVGCLEQLDKFQDAMKQRFGRRPIFLRFNRSPASREQIKLPDIKSDFHRSLLELLQADIEIYQETMSDKHR